MILKFKNEDKMEYNNLQNIAWNISGYSIHDHETGAQDDGYYDCGTLEEKLDYIITFSQNVDGINAVTMEEAKILVSFLDKESAFSNDHFYDFLDLNNERTI